MNAVGGILRRLAQGLRGCRGAFTLDYDGLPLEAHRPAPQGADLEAIGAELAAVIREARQAAADLGLGSLEAVGIRAGAASLLFQDCARQYLLGLVLDPAAGMALARRALAVAARGELAGA